MSDIPLQDYVSALYYCYQNEGLVEPKVLSRVTPTLAQARNLCLDGSELPLSYRKEADYFKFWAESTNEDWEGLPNPLQKYEDFQKAYLLWKDFLGTAPKTVPEEPHGGGSRTATGSFYGKVKEESVNFLRLVNSVEFQSKFTGDAMWAHTFEDKEKRSFVWFTALDRRSNYRGHFNELSFRVSGHKVYKGVRQTRISHVLPVRSRNGR